MVLTVRVTRLYCISVFLLPTTVDEPIPSKILSYNRANRAVAVLCNHQVCVCGWVGGYVWVCCVCVWVWVGGEGYVLVYSISVHNVM